MDQRKNSTKKRKKEIVSSVIEAYHAGGLAPQGSYLGTNLADPKEEPEQDADDL